MYIRLANKELLKNCASKTGSIRIVKACDRISTVYNIQKPVIRAKADGSFELKNSLASDNTDTH